MYLTTDMFSSIHKLIRNYELVYDLSLEQNKIKFKKTDPDSFPVYNTSYKFKSLGDFKPIYSLLDSYNSDFEQLNGFNLEVKKSKIYHQESGEGVFLTSKINNFVLPGTLLGFYPGMIYPSNVPKPNTDRNCVYPYLKRDDGDYVVSDSLYPYPHYNNLTLQKFNEFKQEVEVISNKGRLQYTELPLYITNHLALGHKINHAPPDVEANVKLFDVFIPIKFLPSSFHRYLPNYFYNDYYYEKFVTSKKELNNNKGNIRLVAIVSLKEIRDGEELYFDYM